MDVKILITVAAIIAPIIVGLFWGLYTHSSNTDRHPAKKDIVFKDVCKPEMQRLEDCIEAKLDGFEKLMKQRFDNLESLVRNGGKPPRVQT